MIDSENGNKALSSSTYTIRTYLRNALRYLSNNEAYSHTSLVIIRIVIYLDHFIIVDSLNVKLEGSLKTVLSELLFNEEAPFRRLSSTSSFGNRSTI